MCTNMFNYFILHVRQPRPEKLGDLLKLTELVNLSVKLEPKSPDFSAHFFLPYCFYSKGRQSKMSEYFLQIYFRIKTISV